MVGKECVRYETIYLVYGRNFCVNYRDVVRYTGRLRKSCGWRKFDAAVLLAGLMLHWTKLYVSDCYYSSYLYINVMCLMHNAYVLKPAREGEGERLSAAECRAMHRWEVCDLLIANSLPARQRDAHYQGPRLPNFQDQVPANQLVNNPFRCLLIKPSHYRDGCIPVSFAAPLIS